VELLRVVAAIEHFPGRLDHDRADLLGSLRTAGESDAVVGLAQERLLAFLAVQAIVDDVIEHWLVDHDRVARVGAALVDQRAGLERLDELIEHPGDLAHLLQHRQVTLAFTGRGHGRLLVPGDGLLPLGQENLVAFFHDSHTGRADLRRGVGTAVGVGGPVQGDEGLPRQHVEIVLQVVQGEGGLAVTSKGIAGDSTGGLAASAMANALVKLAPRHANRFRVIFIVVSSADKASGRRGVLALPGPNVQRYP
jgi:hypothetical protein